MFTHHRVASIAGMLVLALSTTAQAATLRLLPFAPATVATSITTCKAPSVDAALTAAAPADLPAIAAGQHVTGITDLRIVLDARGRLTDSSVLTSSGNRWIDRAALAAARGSSFSAEVRDCAPVGGTYALTVDFTQ